MSSALKEEANRANARASTGPRTGAGRARSARNALRHGLSLSVLSDITLTEEVEALAREISGPNAGPELQGLARPIAEAQIDLKRVRLARHALLTSAITDPGDESALIRSDMAQQFLAIDRYERRALSRRKFAIRTFDQARKRASAKCAKVRSMSADLQLPFDV